MLRRIVSALVLFALISGLTVSAGPPVDSRNEGAGPEMAALATMPMGPPTVGDWPPEIDVNRQSLNYGATAGSMTPLIQTFTVSNSGRGALHWSAMSSVGWATVDPVHGGDGTTASVAIDPTGLAAGTYQGEVSVSAWNAVNSPKNVPVQLTVYDEGQDEPPFGSFTTPETNTVASGGVPVTGWALDDIEVDVVGIYRTPEQIGPLVYIGDANLVEGARPDVAAAYPDYPNNTRAGWGYMLLTNALPGGGNGQYTIYAIAKDSAGQQTTLGAKTITCDNDNAVKPFGAIDTPLQGGTISGEQYTNSGWVLAQQGQSIPEDGSTITVKIDGQAVGHPSYGQHRADIEALFPDHANSAGAGAFFELDTTGYADGVHTIQWTATDDMGHTAGIGSRFFTIDNDVDEVSSSAAPVFTVSQSGAALQASPGAQSSDETLLVTNSGGGNLDWSVSTDDDWLVCTPRSGHSGATVRVTALTTDTVGTHRGRLTFRDSDPSVPSVGVDVTYSVTGAPDTQPPFGGLDTPDCGAYVAGSVAVTGWALDDTEVDHVKIYRQGEGGASVYIGDATFVEGARPDVALQYPGYPNHTGAGWSYTVQTASLPGGMGTTPFTLYAVATDGAGNQTTLGSKTILVDNEHAVKPFGAIDAPAPGGVASGTAYVNRGWVLTPQPNAIPTDGSGVSVWVDGVPVGHPTYGQYRQDIADQFPGYANSEGAAGLFELDTTAYDNGVHSIYWTAQDSGGNTDGIGSRFFTINNPSSGYVGGDMAATSMASASVTNTAQYTTIQEAIDNIARGGTVTVVAGNYAESVVLDKNVYVILEGDVTLNGNLTVEAGTWVCPEGTLTLTGDLTHTAGGFDPNGGTVAFSAGLTHTLAGNTLFHNLSVGEGAVIETATAVAVEGTLSNRGLLRETKDFYDTIAMTFGLVDVVIEPTVAGLDRLIIERVDQTHPNARGKLATGRYWRMTPTGAGYTVKMTLPHNETPTVDDKVCRYSGSEWVWACDADSFDEGKKTITREGITAFSDWTTLNAEPTGRVSLPLIRK